MLPDSCLRHRAVVVTEEVDSERHLAGRAARAPHWLGLAFLFEGRLSPRNSSRFASVGDGSLGRGRRWGFEGLSTACHLADAAPAGGIGIVVDAVVALARLRSCPYILDDVVSFVILWGGVNAAFGNWIPVALVAVFATGLVVTGRFDVPTCPRWLT